MRPDRTARIRPVPGTVADRGQRPASVKSCGLEALERRQLFASIVVDSTAMPVETVVDLVVAAARARGIGEH